MKKLLSALLVIAIGVIAYLLIKVDPNIVPKFHVSDSPQKIDNFVHIVYPTAGLQLVQYYFANELDVQTLDSVIYTYNDLPNEKCIRAKTIQGSDELDVTVYKTIWAETVAVVPPYDGSGYASITNAINDFKNSDYYVPGVFNIAYNSTLNPEQVEADWYFYKREVGPEGGYVYSLVAILGSKSRKFY